MSALLLLYKYLFNIYKQIKLNTSSPKAKTVSQNNLFQIIPCKSITGTNKCVKYAQTKHISYTCFMFKTKIKLVPNIFLNFFTAIMIKYISQETIQ